jgi:hypothetical protein
MWEFTQSFGSLGKQEGGIMILYYFSPVNVNHMFACRSPTIIAKIFLEEKKAKTRI